MSSDGKQTCIADRKHLGYKYNTTQGPDAGYLAWPRNLSKSNLIWYRSPGHTICSKRWELHFTKRVRFITPVEWTEPHVLSSHECQSIDRTARSGLSRVSKHKRSPSSRKERLRCPWKPRASCAGRCNSRRAFKEIRAL